MDQELLCFHYPKGSISVVIMCLLFPRTLDVCVCVWWGERVQTIFSLTDLQAKGKHIQA